MTPISGLSSELGKLDVTGLNFLSTGWGSMGTLQGPAVVCVLPDVVALVVPDVVTPVVPDMVVPDVGVPDVICVEGVAVVISVY